MCEQTLALMGHFEATECESHWQLGSGETHVCSGSDYSMDN